MSLDLGPSASSYRSGAGNFTTTTPTTPITNAGQPNVQYLGAPSVSFKLPSPISQVAEAQDGVATTLSKSSKITATRSTVAPLTAINTNATSNSSIAFSRNAIPTPTTTPSARQHQIVEKKSNSSQNSAMVRGPASIFANSNHSAPTISTATEITSASAARSLPLQVGSLGRRFSIDELTAEMVYDKLFPHSAEVFGPELDKEQVILYEDARGRELVVIRKVD
jgi:hypothetical protein